MIRKANIKDVKEIHKLISHFAQKDLMLPRSFSEMYDNIRDFWVFEEKGKICGCCALHICWEDLAEIKSLAVAERFQKRGIGKELVQVCLNEAGIYKINQIFALTYQPFFFKKCGFKRINKNKLPGKIWSECVKCPKFPNCNEEALIYINSKH